jgi:hypothetical protein
VRALNGPRPRPLLGLGEGLRGSEHHDSYTPAEDRPAAGRSTGSWSACRSLRGEPDVPSANSAEPGGRHACWHLHRRGRRQQDTGLRNRYPAPGSARDSRGHQPHEKFGTNGHAHRLAVLAVADRAASLLPGPAEQDDTFREPGCGYRDVAPPSRRNRSCCGHLTHGQGSQRAHRQSCPRHTGHSCHHFDLLPRAYGRPYDSWHGGTRVVA